MLSGQVASYVFLGFFQRARHSAKVGAVLELLKENLRWASSAKGLGFRPQAQRAEFTIAVSSS